MIMDITKNILKRLQWRIGCDKIINIKKISELDLFRDFYFKQNNKEYLIEMDGGFHLTDSQKQTDKIQK